MWFACLAKLHLQDVHTYLSQHHTHMPIIIHVLTLPLFNFKLVLQE